MHKRAKKKRAKSLQITLFGKVDANVHFLGTTVISCGFFVKSVKKGQKGAFLCIFRKKKKTQKNTKNEWLAAYIEFPDFGFCVYMETTLGRFGFRAHELVLKNDPF
jgi:hypothetical protein